ncbi:MAG: vitamin K epoxide reductase family protein [Streptosporangiaceae bacterium]|nr:vitamin K epoxide reductase family protein [Streptosporangiaceae bacterium]MBV9853750.1 vitamin K epoxide reductase family protein [Streptosporangiaceae bacterium]
MASSKSARAAATSSRNGGRTQAASRATATRAPARAGSAGRGGSGATRRDVRDRRDTRDRGRGRPAAEELAPAAPAASGPPLWFQLTTLALALGGLGVSIYETYAHFNGSHLAGCTGTGTESCTKVITSPQSMVFGVIPVAILGLLFYVFVVAIMTPWAWRTTRREVAWLRLASMVTGIGFVIYLIYAELFQIGSICLYCTSVHAITFVLFALTIFAAAVWGTGSRKPA